MRIGSCGIAPIAFLLGEDWFWGTRWQGMGVFPHFYHWSCLLCPNRVLCRPMSGYNLLRFHGEWKKQRAFKFGTEHENRVAPELSGATLFPNIHSPKAAIYVNNCHICSVLSVSFQPGMAALPSATVHRYSPLLALSAALVSAEV